jgi:uncharacterized membrane protein
MGLLEMISGVYVVWWLVLIPRLAASLLVLLAGVLAMLARGSARQEAAREVLVLLLDTVRRRRDPDSARPGVGRTGGLGQ